MQIRCLHIVSGSFCAAFCVQQLWAAPSCAAYFSDEAEGHAAPPLYSK